MLKCTFYFLFPLNKDITISASVLHYTHENQLWPSCRERIYEKNIVGRKNEWEAEEVDSSFHQDDD